MRGREESGGLSNCLGTRGRSGRGGGGRSWIQLLAAAATWLAALAAHASAPTVVSITFDDDDWDQYLTRPVLARYAMRATFYVNSGFVGTPNHMSLAELHALQADGHDIGGHTIDHPDLVSLGPVARLTELCDDRAALLAMGFPAVSFAYPFGSANPDLELLAKLCGYTSARGVAGAVRGTDCPNCPWCETIPPRDAYRLINSGSVLVTTTVPEIERWVTQAESHGGGWVQIIFHHICAGCDGWAITLADFTTFIQWLAAREAQGTVVRTVAEVMGVARAVPSPPSLPALVRQSPSSAPRQDLNAARGERGALSYRRR